MQQARAYHADVSGAAAVNETSQTDVATKDSPSEHNESRLIDVNLNEIVADPRKGLCPVTLRATDEQLPTLRDHCTEDAVQAAETTSAADVNDDLQESVVESRIQGMTVDTSAVQRQRFRSLQVDVENDAQMPVPFPIDRETFPVPSACLDDALVDGQTQLWTPGKPLRIAYVTWNLAAKEPFMPDVAAFCVRPNAHIVVVATQENGDYIGSSKGQMQWSKNLATECLHDRYTLVSQTVMWALHLVVFARSRDVAKYISHVHASSVKTGAKGVSGNKGGVAVGFSVSLSPLLCTSFETVSSSPESTAPNPLSAETVAIIHKDRPESIVSVVTPKLHASTLPDGSATTAQLPDLKARGDQCDHTNDSDRTDPAQNSAAAQISSGPSHLTFLFVNAHLAAHQEAIADRNRGYARIVSQLKVGTRGKYSKAFKQFGKNARNGRVLYKVNTQRRGLTMTAVEGEQRPQSARLTRVHSTNGVDLFQLPHSVPSGTQKHELSTLKARDVTEGFDLTFFGGDLNYRLNGTKDALERIIDQHKDIRSVLMFNDQLNIERQRGRVFPGYREGQLLFRPTYKYDVKNGALGDTYNTGKKKRLPAFCDRVLYKKSHQSRARQVTLRLYTDVRPVRSSDHKPVVALFDVETEEYEWV